MLQVEPIQKATKQKNGRKTENSGLCGPPSVYEWGGASGGRTQGGQVSTGGCELNKPEAKSVDMGEPKPNTSNQLG